MTLDEAIKHAEEVAEEKRCEKCGEEHRQLAEWLKELKQLRETLEIDYIDRAQTQTEIEMNASRYTLSKERGGMGQVEWSDQLIKVSDAVDIIRHLPSVTPARKKGKWINKSHNNGCGITFYISECTCCGKNTFFDCDELLYRYCPNCGAKMDEDERTLKYADKDTMMPAT